MTLAEATAQLTASGQPFEMEEVDVRGVTFRAWKHAPRNLSAVLESSRRFGDERDFLVYEDDRLTFEQHFRAAATFAHWLIDDVGVQRGDRVAVAMRNFPEWSVAFWGAAAAGAIVVPLNAWWKGAELEYGLSDSGSRVLVCDAEREQVLADHFGSLRLDAIVVARPEVGGDGTVADGHLDFRTVIGDAPATALPAIAAEMEPDEDATIFYTSGTTGNPKGALGTNRNFTTNLVNLQFGAARAALRRKAAGEQEEKTGPSRQAAYLLSVPLFHATGCHAVLQSNTAAGGKLVIMHKWDPERALELIERERITSFGGVPAMVWQVLDSPDFDKRDTSSVQAIGYGGAPAPPELVKRITQHFKLASPSNGYGLTETSSLAVQNSGEEYVRKPDSVGTPVPVVDVRVVDEEGNPLPQGEVGELWIKGPNVVKGYWNKPEATAAAITDGWLHSGDVARIDDEGFVFIVDRAKDMLIRGGENVYCVEVEAALYEHPAVSDAAVIGIPHLVLGEEVGAVVQLKSGATATEDELRAHVAERLASFKVPVKIWFSDEPLPRNPAGKILKRELREELIGAG